MTDLNETASQIGVKVAEAQGRAEEMSRAAGKALDDARNDTAGALHTAASSVRTSARQGCDVLDGVAARAAYKLDATASYVEDHDLRSLFAGCRHFIRRHPSESVILAATIGFFAGSAVRRITRTSTKLSTAH